MSRDRHRQVAVTVSYVACLVGSFIGVGAAGGTPIQDAAGGVLGPDATHLAPASGAFSVWSVIYLGLAAYTVVQWTPARTADSRHRAIGWPAAASMLLNAAWILSIQAGWVWVSVVVILALLAVLALILVRLEHRPRRGPVEELTVDGTFGAYLGWVAVATAANISAALVSNGFDGGPLAPEVWALAILVAITVVGSALALWDRGRLAPTATLAWGLVWIGLSRTGGELVSVPTAVAAWGAAGTIVVVTALARRSRAPR